MLFRLGITALYYILWLIIICRGTKPKVLFSRPILIWTGIISLIDIGLTIYFFSYFGCFDNGIVPEDEDVESICSLDKFFVAMAVCFNAWFAQVLILYRGFLKRNATFSKDHEIQDRDDEGQGLEELRTTRISASKKSQVMAMIRQSAVNRASALSSKRASKVTGRQTLLNGLPQRMTLLAAH